MPNITVRLTDRLDALARAHAMERGIAVNALVCFVLDAFFKSQPVPIQAAPPPLAEPAKAPGDDGVTYPLPAAVVQAHAETNGVPPASMGGKPVNLAKRGKKETFVDRQRARDTAFRPKK